jgi:hypothetical protein
MIRPFAIAAGLALAVGIPTAAGAKPARCFSTDDGYFKCDFRKIDRAGSFEIRARGLPGYSLIMEEQGFASGYLRVGGRGIPINGMFVRDSGDGACWNNPEQSVKLCAW